MSAKVFLTDEVRNMNAVRKLCTIFNLNIDQVWTFQQKIPNQSPSENNVTEVLSPNAAL